MTSSVDRNMLRIAYRGFRTPVGSPVGALRDHRPVVDEPTGHEAACWTSPPVLSGFPVRELVPSWTAHTPPGCWIEIELRGHTGHEPATRWYPMARWAEDDTTVVPTSQPDRQDDDARKRTDTLTFAATRTVPGWQIRVHLVRPTGSSVAPVLHSVGAVACGTSPTAPPVTPAPAVTDGDPAAGGVVLDVPRYSQRLHADHHQHWGGGGDSWCSPTSVAMVLAHHGTGPTPDQYAWVDPSDPHPVVDHAARHCFDPAYDGTGNWPFNTAYAGRYGMDAFVTRLRSLTEAERFIQAGLPLVVSAVFQKGQIPGLDYDTRGHLMVLVGFTADGDPVLNDPYASDDDGVRRTVPRGPFEAAWVRENGGTTYVIRPPHLPLPAAPVEANW